MFGKKRDSYTGRYVSSWQDDVMANIQIGRGFTALSLFNQALGTSLQKLQNYLHAVTYTSPHLQGHHKNLADGIYYTYRNAVQHIIAGDITRATLIDTYTAVKLQVDWDQLENDLEEDVLQDELASKYDDLEHDPTLIFDVESRALADTGDYADAVSEFQYTNHGKENKRHQPQQLSNVMITGTNNAPAPAQSRY